MELSFIRILISILESKECFVVLTALEAGLCVLYYRQPDNDILFFLLVTFGVSLVLILIIYLRQRIVFKREFERQKKEAILRERLIIEKEKGKASDVFNNMNEDIIFCKDNKNQLIINNQNIYFMFYFYICFYFLFFIFIICCLDR